jgi:hypothetical protein
MIIDMSFLVFISRSFDTNLNLIFASKPFYRDEELILTVTGDAEASSAPFHSVGEDRLKLRLELGLQAKVVRIQKTSHRGWKRLIRGCDVREAASL